MTLHTEIHEQPESLARLLSEQRVVVEKIGREIRARDVHFVFVAARGTSDNAARYANYLWGAKNHLPLALATPSLFTYYQQPPRLRNALVVGISQSGQSPDIISVVEEGKRQGCLSLVVTNSPDSPLARTGEMILDLRAGEERSVAATKTYTAELLALAMLSAALNEDQGAWDDLAQVPGWVSAALALDRKLAESVERYKDLARSVVLGRGFNYATAFEWALKLKELTYAEAEPYSSADFQHGPIAIVERGFPILAVATSGPVFEPFLSLLRFLREERSADLVVISDEPRALALAQLPLALPDGVPEWLTPLVAIIPAQLFAYHLALAKGFDPDSPRLIHKVTETR